MSSYRGNADGPDQVKAITAVVVVHVVLAAIILTGLNVRMVRQVVEHLTTFDVSEAQSPPPQTQPKPMVKPQESEKPAGAPAKQAEPTPVVAPEPKMPVPSPVPAAKIAGIGSAPSSGAATAGAGTGAGGSGMGTGGGGYADLARFTPARRISKIPDSEYARLSATGIEDGAVGLNILVNRDGTTSNCRITRSSGDPAVDALMCELTLRYLRFLPARDPSGQAVAQDVTFVSNWHH